MKSDHVFWIFDTWNAEVVMEAPKREWLEAVLELIRRTDPKYFAQLQIRPALIGLQLGAGRISWKIQGAREFVFFFAETDLGDGVQIQRALSEFEKMQMSVLLNNEEQAELLQQPSAVNPRVSDRPPTPEAVRKAVERVKKDYERSMEIMKYTDGSFPDPKGIRGGNFNWGDILTLCHAVESSAGLVVEREGR